MDNRPKSWITEVYTLSPEDRVERQRPPVRQPAENLRRVAMQLPEAVEGLTCLGSPLEKRSIKVRYKAFLFLGETIAIVKLLDSLTVATEMSATAPSRFKVGAYGWVTICFEEMASLPIDLLVEWVHESYRLLAPKQLLALLSDGI